MGYVLYGANGSGSSIVEAALRHADVAYEFRRVDMRNHAQRDAAYVAVNPHRKVPTLLTPDGETLTESSAIVVTLAERHPDAGLLPAAGSAARARALRWLMFAASELYPIVEIMDYPERFSPDEASMGGIRDRAIEIWKRRWQTVEAAIDGPYLLGDAFCMTDVYLAVLSKWDLPAEWSAKNAPKVVALAEAVGARPAFAELWPRNFPAK